MPELPEVETVRRGLLPWVEGRVLARVEQRRPDLRWPIPEDFVARTEGRRVERLSRRAKYLLWHLEGGAVMLMHLGMSGRITITEGQPEQLEAHDHIIFTTDAGAVIRFNDARRFGMVDLTTEKELPEHRLLAAIGPEPLGNSFNGPALAETVSHRRTPIKAALLDQKVVAGVGNIYACEALHRAGIAPTRQAARISGKRLEALATAVREVLEAAIAAGGSTLRDHRQPSGELGYFQHTFRVYDREGEPCPNAGCGGEIGRIVQSGRSTFHCPKCQR